MKFFWIGLFLFMVIDSLEGSTIPRNRSTRALKATFVTNINGTYKRENPHTNTEVERSSYKASHKFEHETEEGNWNDYSKKCSLLIHNFLSALTGMISCGGQPNGVYNFHINTNVTQKSDCSNRQLSFSMPTITIEASDSQKTKPSTSPEIDSDSITLVSCASGSDPSGVQNVKIKGKKYNCYLASQDDGTHGSCDGSEDEGTPENDEDTENEDYEQPFEDEDKDPNTDFVPSIEPTDEEEASCPESKPLLKVQPSIKFQPQPDSFYDYYTNQSPSADFEPTLTPETIPETDSENIVESEHHIKGSGDSKAHHKNVEPSSKPKSKPAAPQYYKEPPTFAPEPRPDSYYDYYTEQPLPAYYEPTVTPETHPEPAVPELNPEDKASPYEPETSLSFKNPSESYPTSTYQNEKSPEEILSPLAQELFVPEDKVQEQPKTEEPFISSESQAESSMNYKESSTSVPEFKVDSYYDYYTKQPFPADYEPALAPEKQPEPKVLEPKPQQMTAPEAPEHSTEDLSDDKPHSKDTKPEPPTNFKEPLNSSEKLPVDDVSEPSRVPETQIENYEELLTFAPEPQPDSYYDYYTEQQIPANYVSTLPPELKHVVPKPKTIQATTPLESKLTTVATPPAELVPLSQDKFTVVEEAKPVTPEEISEQLPNSNTEKGAINEEGPEKLQPESQPEHKLYYDDKVYYALTYPFKSNPEENVSEEEPTPAEYNPTVAPEPVTPEQKIEERGDDQSQFHDKESSETQPLPEEYPVYYEQPSVSDVKPSSESLVNDNISIPESQPDSYYDYYTEQPFSAAYESTQAPEPQTENEVPESKPEAVQFEYGAEESSKDKPQHNNAEPSSQHETEPKPAEPEYLGKPTTFAPESQPEAYYDFYTEQPLPADYESTQVPESQPENEVPKSKPEDVESPHEAQEAIDEKSYHEDSEPSLESESKPKLVEPEYLEKPTIFAPTSPSVAYYDYYTEQPLPADNESTLAPEPHPENKVPENKPGDVESPQEQENGTQKSDEEKPHQKFYDTDDYYAEELLPVDYESAQVLESQPENEVPQSKPENVLSEQGVEESNDEKPHHEIAKPSPQPKFEPKAAEPEYLGEPTTFAPTSQPEAYYDYYTEQPLLADHESTQAPKLHPEIEIHESKLEDVKSLHVAEKSIDEKPFYEDAEPSSEPKSEPVAPLYYEDPSTYTPKLEPDSYYDYYTEKPLPVDYESTLLPEPTPETEVSKSKPKDGKTQVEKQQKPEFPAESSKLLQMPEFLKSLNNQASPVELEPEKSPLESPRDSDYNNNGRNFNQYEDLPTTGAPKPLKSSYGNYEDQPHASANNKTAPNYTTTASEEKVEHEPAAAYNEQPFTSAPKPQSDSYFDYYTEEPLPADYESSFAPESMPKTVASDSKPEEVTTPVEPEHTTEESIAEQPPIIQEMSSTSAPPQPLRPIEFSDKLANYNIRGPSETIEEETTKISPKSQRQPESYYDYYGSTYAPESYPEENVTEKPIPTEQVPAIEQEPVTPSKPEPKTEGDHAQPSGSETTFAPELQPEAYYDYSTDESLPTDYESTQAPETQSENEVSELKPDVKTPVPESITNEPVTKKSQFQPKDSSAHEQQPDSYYDYYTEQLLPADYESTLAPEPQAENEAPGYKPGNVNISIESESNKKEPELVTTEPEPEPEQKPAIYFEGAYPDDYSPMPDSLILSGNKTLPAKPMPISKQKTEPHQEPAQHEEPSTTGTENETDTYYDYYTEQPFPADYEKTQTPEEPCKDDVPESKLEDVKSPVLELITQKPAEEELQSQPEDLTSPELQSDSYYNYNTKQPLPADYKFILAQEPQSKSEVPEFKPEDVESPHEAEESIDGKSYHEDAEPSLESKSDPAATELNEEPSTSAPEPQSDSYYDYYTEEPLPAGYESSFAPESMPKTVASDSKPEEVTTPVEPEHTTEESIAEQPPIIQEMSSTSAPPQPLRPIEFSDKLANYNIRGPSETIEEETTKISPKSQRQPESYYDYYGSTYAPESYPEENVTEKPIPTEQVPAIEQEPVTPSKPEPKTEGDHAQPSGSDTTSALEPQPEAYYDYYTDESLPADYEHTKVPETQPENKVPGNKPVDELPQESDKEKTYHKDAEEPDLEPESEPKPTEPEFYQESTTFAPEPHLETYYDYYTEQPLLADYKSTLAPKPQPEVSESKPEGAKTSHQSKNVKPLSASEPEPAEPQYYEEPSTFAPDSQPDSYYDYYTEQSLPADYESSLAPETQPETVPESEPESIATALEPRPAAQEPTPEEQSGNVAELASEGPASELLTLAPYFGYPDYSKKILISSKEEKPTEEHPPSSEQPQPSSHPSEQTPTESPDSDDINDSQYNAPNAGVSSGLDDAPAPQPTAGEQGMSKK